MLSNIEILKMELEKANRGATVTKVSECQMTPSQSSQKSEDNNRIKMQDAINAYSKVLTRKDEHSKLR